MSFDIHEYINFQPFCGGSVAISDSHICLLYKDKDLLMLSNGSDISLPSYKDIKEHYPNLEKKYYLGNFKGVPCYCGEISDKPKNNHYSLIPLRKVASLVPKDLFFICGKGYQILHWDNNNKYCGRCGAITQMRDDEVSKICPQCNLILYPRISPAVIVAITNNDKILLAHNCNFPEGLHSIIAGFLEPSETLEHCVKREVYEEVGLRVKNIKYFGSQPWPYPDSIMIGFIAEYDGGEIKVDNKEILHADWYSIDNLPKLPEVTTIARQIIDSIIHS